MATSDAPNLVRRSPSELYAALLERALLPGFLNDLLEKPLAEMGAALTTAGFEDFTGRYRYRQLLRSGERVALVWIEADIVGSAFKHIADFAARLSAARQCEALYIFTNALAVAPELLDERHAWAQPPLVQITFCFSPEIERLRAAGDPAQHKAVLRDWFGLSEHHGPVSVTTITPVALDEETRRLLVKTLVDTAAKQLVPTGYFERLLRQSRCSGDWVTSLNMAFSSSAQQNARLLVERAAAQGSHGVPAGYTVLGWILHTTLHAVPGRLNQAVIVAVMVGVPLVTGDAAADLSARYQIPSLLASSSSVMEDIGPNIDWEDPGELELQSWDPPAPLLTMTDVAKCVEQQGAVCLITVANITNHLGKPRTGTGFLVGPDLVLTNCHVLLRDWRMSDAEQHEELQRNAPSVGLRFRYTAAEPGKGVEGQTFFLVKDRPVVRFSPVTSLDYVLLRVQPEITRDRGLGPATCRAELPPLKSALHIVQHPQGEIMQVDFQTTGVTDVDRGRGLLRYVTRTGSGSSGSPCFNANWEVVALHHAERPRHTFWSIREGVLFCSIAPHIEAELK